MANNPWNSPYPKMTDKEVDMVNAHINSGNNFWNDHIYDDKTGMLTTAGSMGMTGITAEFTYRMFNYLKIEMGVLFPVKLVMYPYNVTNDKDANDTRSKYSMGGWDHHGSININIPAIYLVVNMLTKSINYTYPKFLDILRATITTTLIHEFSHVKQYVPTPDVNGNIPKEFEDANLAHCAYYWYPILRNRIISVFDVDIYDSVEVANSYHFTNMGPMELFQENTKYQEEDIVRTVGVVFGYAFYTDDQFFFKYFMSFFEFYRSLKISVRFIDALANQTESVSDFGYIRENGIPVVDNINKLMQFIDLFYQKMYSMKFKILNRDEVQNSTNRAILEIDVILSYFCPFSLDQSRDKMVADEIDEQTEKLLENTKGRS